MANIETETRLAEKPEITLVSPSTTGDGNEKQASQAGTCAPQCLPYCRITICNPTCGIILPPPRPPRVA